jgi:hypothetical protein
MFPGEERCSNVRIQFFGIGNVAALYRTLLRNDRNLVSNGFELYNFMGEIVAAMLSSAIYKNCAVGAFPIIIGVARVDDVAVFRDGADESFLRRRNSVSNHKFAPLQPYAEPMGAIYIVR